MSRLPAFLNVWLLAICLAACQTAGEGGRVVQMASQLSAPDSTLHIQSGDARISPMDLLEIAVFGAPDLDNSYQIDFEGRLKMPLIGSVSAAGYSAAQLASILETRLEESYLQKADVTVRILDTRKRFLTVEGSVKNPGMYPVEGQLTLLQAVALSGGATDNANPRKVVVFRQIEGRRHAAAFDLVDIRRGDAEDPLIYANDIVVMDGSEARRRYGDILRSIPLLTLFVLY